MAIILVHHSHSLSIDVLRMKTLYITLICMALSLPCTIALAQTPFDAFSPETSRIILDGDSIAAWRAQRQSHRPYHRPTHSRPDTILCALIADLRNEQLLLVDIASHRPVAYAPFTDEIKNWLSVDPLVDKNITTSPYLYCNGNPIMFIDPDGRDDEWSWNGETATRTHIDNGTDFVRVNGRLITTYDYSQENIENIDMLEAILPYYCDQAGIEQTKGCAYFAFPATALTDFSDNRLIGLVVDEDGYLDATMNTASNIINTFCHEDYHKNDSYVNASSWKGELQAINAQMTHNSWNGTTDEFKNGLIDRALGTIMREINQDPDLLLSTFQPFIPLINLKEKLPTWQ